MSLVLPTEEWKCSAFNLYRDSVRCRIQLYTYLRYIVCSGRGGIKAVPRTTLHAGTYVYTYIRGQFSVCFENLAPYV